ncbi:MULTISPECIES: hypothetical protein [unclassified Luteococcus]|uniref:hypothetical protein n=1 Tax=unclassified Luteococcus TaxID=2639923 RepID=UPI00313E9DD4
MSLLSRKNRPDSRVVADYRRQTGHDARVLATGSGPRAELLAFADRMAVRVADEPWRAIGWHQVQTGGWNAERAELHWRLTDGSKEAVQLTEPRSLPTVFRERVQATIAVQDQFDVPGGGAVLISARRDLSAGSPELVWSATAVRGARMDNPVVKSLADEALARLRADYDF